MVVILDIFPPEEEIVEDVDDILDFFKPKEEKPLEATFPFPVETPLTKSEIVGTKSVSDVFKNKEKQPSALMATSPSIETPLPKTVLTKRVFHYDPKEKQTLALVTTTPSYHIQQPLPKRRILESKPAILSPKRKQSSALVVATPPLIEKPKPSSIMKLDLLAQVMNESGLYLSILISYD